MLDCINYFIEKTEPTEELKEAQRKYPRIGYEKDDVVQVEDYIRNNWNLFIDFVPQLKQVNFHHTETSWWFVLGKRRKVDLPLSFYDIRWLIQYQAYALTSLLLLRYSKGEQVDLPDNLIKLLDDYVKR